MSYTFSKTMKEPFTTALSKVTEELKNQGFGIISEIDMQETLRKKLGVDFRRYKILGACNPALAYEALQAEDDIGTMLPCNVIIQELNDGLVKVSAVDPVASMMAVNNDNLAKVATQVRHKLDQVVGNL